MDDEEGDHFVDLDVEEILALCLLYILLVSQRSHTAYRKTVRCSPESFDALYNFDFGLAVLLTYYGNGCGIDGDGIGGAAVQLGTSRAVAGVYIKRLEDLLYDMMHDVIFFPAPDAVDEWDGLVEGFARRGSDFPDVACVFDGTIIRTRRPRNHMVWRSEIHPTTVWLLSTIVVNFDTLVCSLEVIPINRCGINLKYLGPAHDTCIWPFLTVPFDKRRGNRLSRKQRYFNFHLSSTRIFVECVFGKIKGRFKVLNGVTDRHAHTTNARMICSTAVLHNLLVDIAMHAFDPHWERTEEEINLGEAKRNTYMEQFYRHDNE
ncbi:uncharacterized protein PITG_04127 [Phytophthora infestans T30-4]|uniref:DDE Tnp4 domain-containing protein n=1 Tax=Phytophthora infestans (strain T30-4) TaxID=403677 RepID=D0N0M1_PHYIT|nr:uncharacterized protein PITG_04127 [Phytophthora infestans T30-4]EEY67184.1 conserved hypothetical protein [Phytophthora infestans T30-4]|eukprot:XP_002905832.1 conserved hypothetical protein [Phytophthora infestans T30-4]